MNKDINLLKNSSENQEKKEALEKFKKFLIKIAFIYLFLIFILGMIYLYFTFNSKKINQEIEYVSEQIKQYAKIENLQVALKQRISAINKLLGNQGDEILVIETLENLLGENNTITTLNINKDTVIITGQARDKQTIVDFSNRVENFASQQSYLVFGPLIWNSEGSYDWSLETHFSKNQ